jgi:hypothetical protein
VATVVDGDEWGKGYAKVVAQAWSGKAYKERLLRDPGSVLTEAGLAVPSSVEITVVEDSAEKRHLVLPPKPAEEEVTEEALAGVAAGESVGIVGAVGVVEPRLFLKRRVQTWQSDRM